MSEKIKVIEIGEWQPTEDNFSSHRRSLEKKLENFKNASEEITDAIDYISFRVDKLEQIVYAMLNAQGLYAKHEDETDPYVEGRYKMSLQTRPDRSKK